MDSLKLRNFISLFSVIGYFLVLSLTYFYISDTLSQHNVTFVERNSLNIGHTLLQIEKDTLLDSQGQLRQEIPVEEFDDFDHRLRMLLEPMEMVKIKIFAKNGTIIYSTDHSKNGTIIYSTDHSIINTNSYDNIHLKNALEGKISVNLSRKESITDLQFKDRKQVDVMETYLPIQDYEGEIIGVYEVYLDVTDYQKEATSLVRNQLVFLGLLLGITLFIANVLMWINSKKMMVLENELNYKANHDELTGCFNRSYLNEILTEELVKVKSKLNNDYQAGILLIDIDYFKKFNDEQGHLVGDAVLTEFALFLKTIIRSEDELFRYGGEEFLVFMPLNSDELLLETAQKLQKLISEKEFSVLGLNYQLTASIGVSHIDINDNVIDEVISRADQALYYVKHNGRNNAVSFDQIKDSV